jgi:ElaB/YqjD/DUF883 family membrane-anchored ribosome-binding protein
VCNFWLAIANRCAAKYSSSLQFSPQSDAVHTDRTDNEKRNQKETKSKESIMSTTDRLVTDLKRIVRNSEELLHTTNDAVGDKAREVRGRLSDGLDTAKRTCRDLEDKTIEGAKAADKTIRDHPYQSIGIAFGVALLIGVLVTRK